MWWRSAGWEMVPAVWSSSRKSIWIETNVDFHTLKLAVQTYCEGNDAEGVRALQIPARFSPSLSQCQRENLFADLFEKVRHEMAFIVF